MELVGLLRQPFVAYLAFGLGQCRTFPTYSYLLYPRLWSGLRGVQEVTVTVTGVLHPEKVHWFGLVFLEIQD